MNQLGQMRRETVVEPCHFTLQGTSGVEEIPTEFAQRTTRRFASIASDGLHSCEIVTCPVPSKPVARAAAGDRSISLPRTQGPRSLMRTVTQLL
jgi:hypothetical protein